MSEQLSLGDQQDEQRPIYHIRHVRIENFERLELLEMPLGPGMTQVVSEKNGAGKSSGLNGLAAVFGQGKTWLPADPIHGDAEEARLEVEVPPYKVTRVFKRDKPTSIEIRRLDDNSKLESPTELLAEWRSDLTFDPLAFVNMTDSQRRDTLLRALGLEDAVAELVEKRKAIFTTRTGVNTTVTRLKGAVSEYVDLTEAPEVPSTEDVIEKRKVLDEQRDAHDEAARLADAAIRATVNATASATRLNEDAIAAAERATATAAGVLTNASASANVLLDDANIVLGNAQAAVEAAKRNVKSAKQEGAGLVTGANDGIAAAKATADASIKKADEDGNAIVVKAAEAQDAAESAAENAPARPSDEAFAALDTQLTEAADKAADLARWNQAVKVRGELSDEQQKSGALTAEIAAIDEAKIALINEAGLPLPELGITDGGVTFNGRPFDQANDAEKLLSGWKVGLAPNPQLRLALIRNGSQLDDDNLALFHTWALEDDAQVLVERLERNAEPGDAVVVIEDGRRVGGGDS